MKKHVIDLSDPRSELEHHLAVEKEVLFWEQKIGKKLLRYDERAARQAAAPVEQDPKVIAKRRSLVRKAAAFAKAVTGPKCDEQEFQRRLKVCQTCPYRREKDAKYYCDACGCPNWSKSELHTKLRYQRLECPDERW